MKVMFPSHNTIQALPVESKTLYVLIMTNLLNTNHKPYEFMLIDDFA